MIAVTNEQQFNELMQVGKSVFMVGAPWCAPCKAMKPVVEEASKDRDETFAYIDLDDNPELAGLLRVRGVPTIVFFEDGGELGRHVGHAGKASFSKTLEEKFDKG